MPAVAPSQLKTGSKILQCVTPKLHINVGQWLGNLLLEIWYSVNTHGNQKFQASQVSVHLMVSKWESDVAQ